VIGDLLRYTPRGDCLSIVQVLVPSIKPFVLLLPRRLTVSMREESWVDFVCINQEDERERERQIQSMAKIYGQEPLSSRW